MNDLRRLTVKVLLALLVFQIIGNFFDDLWFRNSYTPGVEIYALLAGMITGLFTPEILRGRTGRKDEDDEDSGEE